MQKFSDFLGYDVSGYINGEVKIARVVYGYGFNNVDPKKTSLENYYGV